MALVIREVNNIGDPLCDSSGTILAGVHITFELVDQYDKITDAWDAQTGERVAPIRETAITDEAGEFSISLWPNDRGTLQTHYRCTTKVKGVKVVHAALPTGDLSPLKWIFFAAGSQWISAYPLSFYVGPQGPAGPQGPPGTGGGGSITAVTASSGEIVTPTVIDNGDGSFSIVWEVTGTSEGAAPDVIVSATGESLQAVVTIGGEGEYFVEWRVL